MFGEFHHTVVFESSYLGCHSLLTQYLSPVNRFCSGQSNMWLPMNMDTSRNVTYDAILAGKYRNIRMHTMMHNNQPDGGIEGYDLDIAPPPPPWRSFGGDPAGGWLLPSVGSYANKTCRDALGPQGNCQSPDECEMCTAYKLPNQDWLFNSINQFSAACWHFAEHLTDIAEAKNETIVPYGLVASHWGGTMVEHWQPNSTLNAGVCKNNSGGAYAPWQNGRWDIDSGGLYNGMVRPFLNMTIRGALWYQGENNVFQCHGANSSLQHGKDSGGPLACGSIADSTGYACMMKNLIDTWREGWSVEPGTADPSFPFGLVSLAGGTSEGAPLNMGAFRYAQTGNTGLLPNEQMPNTFVAQAFDTGDPCEGGSQCCLNRADGQGGWACESGEAPYTAQFMGGIHPRVKKIVGTRLAKAARALVYEDKTQVWTGPVLESCTVTNDAIVLKFDQDKMLDDTIQVLQPTVKAIDLTRHPMANNDWSPDQLALLQQLVGSGGSTPMEVQLNGATTGEMSDGIWLPVSLQDKCSNTPDRDNVSPGSGACSWNYTSSTKLAGWDEVHIPLPGFGSLVNNLTAVRYGWGGNPCCPGVNRFMIPCPPNSCPIQTFNSSLPAPPFWATIASGKCDWISTKGPPPK